MVFKINNGQNEMKSKEEYSFHRPAPRPRRMSFDGIVACYAFSVNARDNVTPANFFFGTSVVYASLR